MTLPIFVPSPGEALFLGLLALFIDALLGGHRMLGRVPGPDTLLRAAGLFFGNRLAPARDTPLLVWPAGIVLVVALVAVAAVAGRYLDNFAAAELWIVLLKAGLLALVLGQRIVIDNARELAGRLAGPAAKDAEGRYAAARWMVERLSNRFTDGLVANLFWFVLGGFTALLAYRAIAVLTAIGSPNGARRPDDPVFWLAGWLYWAASLAPGIAASLLFLVAGAIVAPQRAFHGAGFMIAGGVWRALPARLWPLHVLCRALNLTLKADPNGRNAGREWIGAKGARARARAADVRKAMLMVVSGWLLAFAGLAMLLLQVLR